MESTAAVLEEGRKTAPRRQAPAPAGVTAGGGWSAGTRAVPRVSWRASPGRAAKVSPAPCVFCVAPPRTAAHLPGPLQKLLLPPPDHPACAMPPAAAPLAGGGPGPRRLRLVTLPGHSLVHGLHEGLLMRRFYPYMSVRTALSASWPHTNPQPAFHTENLTSRGGFPRAPEPTLGQRGIRSWSWRVWRTCVAHAPHSSMLTHFLSTFTSHLETTLRGTCTYMANAVAESGMGKRMLSVRKLVGYDSPRPKLGFLHVKSKETGIAINEARPSPSSAGG